MSTFPMPQGPIVNKAFLERGDASVVKWDVIPIADGQAIEIVFESKSSAWREGVWLGTDSGIEVNNQIAPSIDLWYDTAPKRVVVTCRTKDGRLHLYNIWDRGQGRNSQALTSGMRVEVAGSHRRYFCNDVGFDTMFNKLVFSVNT